jgi:hypothetical protein
MAAGHPPLPSFELATFCQKLPPHWYELKDTPFLQQAPKEVQDKYHFRGAAFQQTRLVLATATVGLQSFTDLVADRARVSGPTPEQPSAWPPVWFRLGGYGSRDARWPELRTNEPFGLPADDPAAQWPQIALVQTDCTSCHHELRSPSWRQLRGSVGSRPGRPPLLTWPFALAGLAEPSAELAAAVRGLRLAAEVQPYGEPAAVARAAGDLAARARPLPAPPADLTRPTVLALLRQVARIPDDQYPDFDSARQIAAAFKAMYGDVPPAGQTPARVQELLAALDRDLNLVPDPTLRARFNAERKASGAEGRAYTEVMQQVADQELAAYLARVAAYDPLVFKARLRELAGLLPTD